MKTLNFIKIFLSILIGICLAGLCGLVVASTKISMSFLQKIDIKYFYFACPALCFLLSLFFLKLRNKNLFITLALMLFVVTDLFFVLDILKTNNLNIGMYVLCGAQLCFVIYLLFHCKSVGMVIFSIALRVALSLLIYFILPQYIALSVLQIVYLIYLCNSVITLLTLIFIIKTRLLLYIGYVFLLLSDLLLGLYFGFATILNISASAITILTYIDFYFLFKIVGLFIIALFTVWHKEKTNLGE